MNIFKILASGDGSINEPNVSAFLGYLLDPGADHGISDALLKCVLYDLYDKNRESSLKGFLVDKSDVCRNLSAHSNFKIEVLLEQSFTGSNGKKKEIVDIVILCFEKKIKGKESLAKIVLSDSHKGDLKQIFLVENKIRDNASREDQLVDQYNATLDTLVTLLESGEDEIKKKLSVIFISPNGDKSNNQFQELEKLTNSDIPKVQVYWSDFLENDRAEHSKNSIAAFLKYILLTEAQGNIEAINDYSKATIKSFIAFIENSFKSTIEEELEGETVRDVGYDFEEFKLKYKDEINDKFWEIFEEFQRTIKARFPNCVMRHSPTHPVSVFIDGKKIFSLSRNGLRLKIQLIHRNHQISRVYKDVLLESLHEFKGLEIIPIGDKLIEIKTSFLSIEQALAIFEKQYELIPK